MLFRSKPRRVVIPRVRRDPRVPVDPRDRAGAGTPLDHDQVSVALYGNPIVHPCGVNQESWINGHRAMDMIQTRRARNICACNDVSLDTSTSGAPMEGNRKARAAESEPGIGATSRRPGFPGALAWFGGDGIKERVRTVVCRAGGAKAPPRAGREFHAGVRPRVAMDRPDNLAARPEVS